MHDDRRLNPLRLLIAGLIVGYFAWLFVAPAPYQPGMKPAQPVAAQPAMPETINCHGDIQRVAFDQHEIRLQITGAGERIRVFTDQGSLMVSTKEAGSAGEYRIRTPAPATAVQLDDCPVVDLR
jgi:hypothetical protein